MNKLNKLNKFFQAGVGVALAAAGMLGVALQQSAFPVVARTAQQATATPRPLPKFLLRAVADPSPKVDGVVGGEQVRMQADLPTGSQPGRPFFGDLFKFKLRENKLQNGSRAIFIIRDVNGNDVYKHTENNLPFCLFGNEDNQPCRRIPANNEGYLYWPESDGRPAQFVQPGRYFLSATIENGNNTICSTSEDFAFDISQEFETPPTAPSTPQYLPASAGSASITSPRNNPIWQGVVTIRGTATLRNFAYYKFEFEDERCGVTGGCFVADVRQQVRNGVLLNMDTRKYPNGNYLLRLLVIDRSGRILSTIPRISISIQN